MSQATVHLLRHGEVFNPDGVLYGRLPEFHLSDRGVAMAVRLAEHFRALADDGATMAYLAASPLTRAQETAQPSATALGLDLNTDERLIEAQNHFEGLKVSASELLKPKYWRYFRNPFLPSWGEPYREQVARMRLAIDAARLEALERGGDGAQAILVSHQLPIWVTHLSLQKRQLFHDPRARECTLASLTTINFEGSEVTGVRYSEPAAALLPGAASTPGA
ncbi:broad specificity phosphatase PhoE [Psychromicrobium silvestre]|uniref:Broad specificity phosphatase PhoE n=1 Tax=Psychromicrobium silvestre TaxID=1645614 RepID=A0A7Y9S8P0_9MICC|nr:histidine phosphatase family protein [Psychromicrobium silvestre]NYE95542.1 broad specificity phosphatase PhoE [Psychromicrobium silvestre]